MEAPTETPKVVSGAPLPQSGEIVLAKFEALTSHGNECGSQIPEQMEEQVLGYLEVQPSEVQLVQDSSTFYLQPQEIEIDGEHLILAQGEEAGEIIVVVSTDQEHSAEQAVAELAQGAVVNATMMHSESGENKAHMFVVNQSNSQFTDRKTETSPSIKTEIEQLPKSLTVEQVTANTQNDINTENRYSENILPTKASITVSHSKETDLETTKNTFPHSSSSREEMDRKLMQLACIAHEMEIERSHTINQTHNSTSVSEEIPSKTSVSENEVSSSSIKDNESDKSRIFSSDVIVQSESSTEGKQEVSANEVSGLSHILSDKPESSVSDMVDPPQTCSDKSESPAVAVLHPNHNVSDKLKSSINEMLNPIQTLNKKLEPSTKETDPSHKLSEKSELSINEELCPSQTVNEEPESSVNEVFNSNDALSDKRESSANEAFPANQTLESIERNRRSVEAAETIAALHHSNRLLHVENDQSVPSYSNAFPPVENSSSLVPETQPEFNADSTDTSTSSSKANMKKEESKNAEDKYEGKQESELTPACNNAAYIAISEEGTILEIRENQVEDTVISDSSENKQIEESLNHVETCSKEECSRDGKICFMVKSILESKTVTEEIGEIKEFSKTDREEVLCEKAGSEIGKDVVEVLCRQTSEIPTCKMPVSLTPLNQAHAVPLSVNTSVGNNSETLGVCSNVIEDSSCKSDALDFNSSVKKVLIEICTKADSNVSLETEESLSSSNVGSAKVINEATEIGSNSNNSEMCTFELNANEISCNLRDKFSQDKIKSSSDQAATSESVLDASTDQVVPQIEIACGSYVKNSGGSSMDQSSSDSWLGNKQEESTNFSEGQKVTDLPDLGSREHLKTKMADQTHCFSSDICMQKDENYQCHDVSNETNTTEIKMHNFDKTCGSNFPMVKGVVEERKRVIQTAEYVQKPLFVPSTAKPLRPKQPVVIHLRSSISKSSVSDLNRNVNTNKPLLYNTKENNKDNEILSKPTLSDIEESCIRPQVKITNDNEHITDANVVQNNADTKESSIVETNSGVEMQETGNNDPRSVSSDTSHSSTEISSTQLIGEKNSIENEIKNSTEHSSECLTPKIKKQFHLLISAEKSDSEVCLSSIKSKINQKLQTDSDDNENLKEMGLECTEQPTHMTENIEKSQTQSPLTDSKILECGSDGQLESEEGKMDESILKTRGTKRKSSLSSPNKIAKLSAVDSKESIGEEQHMEMEVQKKTSKRKAVDEFEKLAKQPKSSLKEKTNGEDQIFKSKKSTSVQKTWCLRSRNAPTNEAKDTQDGDFSNTAATDRDMSVSVIERETTEMTTENSIGNSTEVGTIHPLNETSKPELLSASLLESVAEDSDHSGISEDLLSQPPVLITRNKFLNSNSLLLPKSKRQYIKKHVKSKSSTSLSVQKVQSPRKYSPRKQKSPVLPSADALQKKHLRTKSEPILTTSLEREEEATTAPLKVCDFRIRCQTPTTPPDKIVNYSCVGCRFRTTRVQNLIHHYREKCSYTGPDAFHWDVDQIEGAKREDSQKTLKANGCSVTKHIIDTGKNVVDSTTIKKFHIKSADMMEETVDSDSSNSDDLPPAFDTPSKKKFGFAEDDVVWVEWKALHWPALVRKIYVKAKKASIMFIDSPSGKKGIRVPIKKISTFNNAERNKKYLSEGRAVSAHSDSLVKAVQKAEDFLRKRCLGINISAAQFFGNLDDFPECMSDRGSSTGTPSEPGDVCRERHLSDVSSSRSFSPSLRTNEELSKQSEDSEDKCESTDSESVARRKEKRKHQNAKLLQCIKDGKVETHLLGVYRNTIASERHKLFHSNVASERNQLKHVSWFGPIDDEEQQEEIYDYCLQLFKSACQYKETFDLVAYMFEVWVPEAVVRAISRVRRLSMTQAEETFAKGVNWSKAEKEEARKEISDFPFTDEDRHEHRERMADSLRLAGVKENVIEELDL